MENDLNLDDDLGTIRWFGTAWPDPASPAAVCSDERAHIPTPVGSECTGCGYPIEDNDSGVTIPSWSGSNGPDTVWVSSAFHRACFLRTVMGCSAALRGEPHDHNVDLRDDALRVEEWLRLR